jgi:hypothetical protein
MNESDYEIELERLKEMNEKFYDYFFKNIHKDKEYWERKNRDALFGVYNTNNYCESIIKNIEVF